MIKGGVKKVSNLIVRENKDGTLIVAIPRNTAIRMSLKHGDSVSVIKEQWYNLYIDRLRRRMIARGKAHNKRPQIQLRNTVLPLAIILI